MEKTIQPQPGHGDPKVELVRAVNRRWRETKGANTDEVLGAFADTVEMLSVLSPDIPHEVAGSHFTKAQAARYFESVARDWQMIDFIDDRYIADEDDLVMVGRCQWRNRATGRDVDSPYVQIMHFENGKVIQFIELFDSLGFTRALGWTCPPDAPLAPARRFGLREPTAGSARSSRPPNPDLATAEHFYPRWEETRGGNFEEALAVMDDAIEMRTVLTGDVPIAMAGRHDGKAQAREYFEGLLRDWEMLEWDVERFIAQDRDVVMIGYCRFRNRETGREVATPKVDICHFEQGKVTHFLELFDSLGFAHAARAA